MVDIEDISNEIQGDTDAIVNADAQASDLKDTTSTQDQQSANYQNLESKFENEKEAGETAANAKILILDPTAAGCDFTSKDPADWAPGGKNYQYVQGLSPYLTQALDGYNKLQEANGEKGQSVNNSPKTNAALQDKLVKDAESSGKDTSGISKKVMYLIGLLTVLGAGVGITEVALNALADGASGCYYNNNGTIVKLQCTNLDCNSQCNCSNLSSIQQQCLCTSCLACTSNYSIVYSCQQFTASDMFWKTLNLIPKIANPSFWTGGIESLLKGGLKILLYIGIGLIGLAVMYFIVKYIWGLASNSGRKSIAPAPPSSTTGVKASRGYKRFSLRR
jgi:hypothetical protein